MEGVEYQLRPTQNATINYPLSPERRQAEGDQFRRAKQELQQDLGKVWALYSSSNAPPHNGPPNCQRCAQRKNATLQAFLKYFGSQDPSAWSHSFPDYQHQIQQAFANPEGFDIEAIYKMSMAQLRQHLKSDICSTLSEADRETYTSLFESDLHSLKDILELFLSEASKPSPSPSSTLFLHNLQNTTTPDQRAHLLATYYCTHLPTDPPSVRTFKSKYASLFLSLPPSVALSQMRSEASSIQKEKIKGFEEKLSELEMAQRGHMRRKSEKERKMEEEKELEKCGLGGCEKVLDLGRDEGVECAVCEWILRRVRGHEGERGVVYCGVGHAKDDFDDHDRDSHACSMRSHCLYYPEMGPPSENIGGGICQNCADEELISWFCSQKCYARNLETHRNDVHVQKAIPSDIDVIEQFRPMEDMEIVS